MNAITASMNKHHTVKLFSVALAAAAIYCFYYFALCQMPVFGTPTFRIDFFATTIGRANDDLLRSLIHARPVSELYIYAQALLAKYFLEGQASLIIYPVQHVALLIYFFSIVLVVESLLKTKLSVVAVLAAWLLFMTNPGILGSTYKLETIVGTLSMVFGGLSLVFLTRWEDDKRGISAILFLGFYLLSIYAKEDFILPPIFLLAWYIFTGGDGKYRLNTYKWLVVAMMVILISFLAFNKLMLPSRSYMDPQSAANSPYFMTLDPASLLKVFLYYTTGVGLHITILTIFYLAASIIAILKRTKIKETIFIGLITGSLMAPYLIMPNHVFPYYGINWWVWQCIMSFALLKILFPRTSTALAIIAGICILVPGINGILRHRSTDWHQSNYLRTKFAISNNIHETLIRYRKELNREKIVGVVGVGPTQIDQSPWQGNGETAFYLKDDLGVTSQWIVFVKTGGADYVINEAPVKTVEHNADTPNVYVEDIGRLRQRKDLPLLVFHPDGTGIFIDHASNYLDNPGEFSLSPFPLPASGGDVRRKIATSEDYEYLRGFHTPEAGNGRWLSDNNVVLLAPQSGDQFELLAYTLPATAYRDGTAPRVTVSFNGCPAGSEKPTPGRLSKISFAIPDSCGITAGTPVNVRIKIDNLVDTSKQGDKRTLSILSKELGFVAGPGQLVDSP